MTCHEKNCFTKWTDPEWGYSGRWVIVGHVVVIDNEKIKFVDACAAKAEELKIFAVQHHLPKVLLQQEDQRLRRCCLFLWSMMQRAMWIERLDRSGGEMLLVKAEELLSRPKIIQLWCAISLLEHLRICCCR